MISTSSPQTGPLEVSLEAIKTQLKAYHGHFLPFAAPPLCNKDTIKGKKSPPVGGFGCLELCLYGIRELVSAAS